MVTTEFLNHFVLAYFIKCFCLNPSELINLLKTLFVFTFYLYFSSLSAKYSKSSCILIACIFLREGLDTYIGITVDFFKLST